MRTVTVLATGGTIATRSDESGTAVARASGNELVQELAARGDVSVLVDDVFRVGGYLMTLPLMHQLASRAERHLRTDVAGLVVTHGTDTTEETAYFLDLFVDDDRPVVVTGAQRPADAPDGDGPRNLTDAITVAGHPRSRGLGALIVFGGRVFAARGTRKSHTLAPDTFTAPSGGQLGWVRGETVQIDMRPQPRPRLPLSALDLADVRVDVVACYPGADATALHAFADAGASGVVLQATGAGNANREICSAVAELSRRGLVVVTSTRVESGPVAAIYGNGGGRDLESAGAVSSGSLRPSQARVLLAALLGVHGDPHVVRTAFSTYANDELPSRSQSS